MTNHNLEEFRFLKETSYSCGTFTNNISRYRHIMTNLPFVKIPAGTLTVSGNTLEIPSFLLCQCLVTQDIWTEIMEKNPSIIKGKKNPVERIEWQTCQAFCEKTNLQIPTEIQWEYAARAGAKGKYYWGEEVDDDFFWFKANSNRTTRPVAGKKPNAFGLCDMIGNVWEWCLAVPSVYGEENNPAPIKRGGAWNSYPEDCYCQSREYTNKGSSNLGIRPCFALIKS